MRVNALTKALQMSYTRVINFVFHFYCSIRMPFSVILACTLDCGIGKDGMLPWSLPPDLKRFREITSHTTNANTQNAIIMGRKTWESLPKKPLPNRYNIVVSSHANELKYEGVTFVSSFDSALQHVASRTDIEDVYVIGGTRVFEEALQHPQCQTVYVTMINHAFSCDTFFNPKALSQFTMDELSEEKKYNDISYKFAVFTRTIQ